MFTGQEKAFDTVTSDEMWRTSKTEEYCKNVKHVMSMYDRACTYERGSVGMTVNLFLKSDYLRSSLSIYPFNLVLTFQRKSAEYNLLFQKIFKRLSDREGDRANGGGNTRKVAQNNEDGRPRINRQKTQFMWFGADLGRDFRV